MKRLFDLTLAILLIIIFIVPCIIFVLVNFIAPRFQLVFWSKRIGKNNKEFMMPKLRTMKIDTPNVATHLLVDPKTQVTKIGQFLRKYSIDEIPQVWSVLKGDMSFVGPRPALYNQFDLIKIRNLHGVECLLPGITGWAQINGRDSLSINEKVTFDIEYLTNKSFLFDIKIIFLTLVRVLNKKNISH